MNKRVTRTLIILLVILAVTVYIRRSTNVPEEPEVSVAARSVGDVQTITQQVLPDDEVSFKINGVDGETVQENEPEQPTEVGFQPVRYTRDLGV